MDARLAMQDKREQKKVNNVEDDMFLKMIDDDYDEMIREWQKEGER